MDNINIENPTHETIHNCGLSFAARLLDFGVSEKCKAALKDEFPELKESKDERINRAIFKALSKKEARDVLRDEHIEVSEALSYLERQKEQKPAEWSEDDEAFLKVAIAICNRYSHKDIADWLKSLRPQLHWKPSEEQVSILGKVFAGCNLNDSERDSMVDLFYNLKQMV